MSLMIELHLDGKINDPSKLGNNAHVNFRDKNFANFRFVEENSHPAVRGHLAIKEQKFRRNKKTWNKSFQPAVNVAAPFTGMAVGAKIENVKRLRTTTSCLKS